MHSEEDKQNFSKRLRTALNLAGLGDLSLADIATKFNLRHTNKPVTPQSVHNWLIGASIPTPDKIETLAKWLNTSSEWLRHGQIQLDSKLTQDELLLLQYFRSFPSKQQQTIINLLHDFHSLSKSL